MYAMVGDPAPLLALARLQSGGIPLVRVDVVGQPHPAVPSALVNGVLRRRKRRVGEGADGHRNRSVATFFRMKDVRAANGTESKPKPCALVARTNELAGNAGNCVRRTKCGDGGKDAPGSLLTGEAMAYANAERFALHLDLQLAATTGRRSRSHFRSRQGVGCRHGVSEDLHAPRTNLASASPGQPGIVAAMTVTECWRDARN